MSMVTGWMSVNFYRYGSWVRRPFENRRACVSGNCERSARVYTVDDEDIRSSGLVQVNDGLYAEVPLWCASEPTA
jgi:hypothetical protein